MNTFGIFQSRAGEKPRRTWGLGEQNIQPFESTHMHSKSDAEQEKRYFSVVEAMPSESGVMRKTLAADVPTILRLIQSSPSPQNQSC